MSKRAVRKKLSKKFKVGDVVTWGRKESSYRVVKVTDLGVWVDSPDYGVLQKDGSRWHFVPFIGVKAYGTVTGPPEHVD